jgi:Na+/proline symporter
MWCFANKTSEPFRWQQVVASSIVIGIILFTFTIFQGLGGNILVANGVFESANDKNLVPQLINLLSESTPWLVGLLAVCALAAMQSTGAAYMSTFSGMVTRDLYKHYIAPEATDRTQKLCGRIFVVVVTVAALFVAAQFTGAIVMLGGLAVAYGFQMYPALMGVCYFPWLTRKGVVWGLAAGLIAVTLTDRTVALLPVIFGAFLPEHLRNLGEWYWGAFPLTIHSAGWGIFLNLTVAILVSKFGSADSDEQENRSKHHAFLQAVSGLTDDQKKWVTPAWILTVIWFLVGFGPFATIGNTLFSDPNTPATWAPFGLPSLWVWQLLMLIFGIFVMWMLAFKVGLSKPIPIENVESQRQTFFAKQEAATT